MTHEDPEISLSEPAVTSRMSRRGLLRSAGGIGIAGVAAGMLIDTTAASAATTGHAAADDASASSAADAVSTPLVAHVHDARTGEVDLFTGEQHVRVQNPALARALAQAATTGR